MAKGRPATRQAATALASHAMFIRVTCSRRAAATALAAVLLAAVGCGAGSKLVLTEEAEAHRTSSDLRVQFTRAADASNRAVMADTDEASSAAAHEAVQARQAVQRDIDALYTILEDLGDRNEAAQLERFKARFEEYQKLDDTILPLAVENTNIKAQRLAFGPAQEAVSAFRQAVDAAARTAAAKNDHTAAIVSQAIAGVLDVQVMQARHIAESDDSAMSRMEAAMTASLATAHKGLETLRGLLPSAAGSPLAAAAAALDTFTAANAEIVALSRRNSNVRSLALSLGKKRTVTAECSDLLQALEEALASHHYAATR